MVLILVLGGKPQDIPSLHEAFTDLLVDVGGREVPKRLPAALVVLLVESDLDVV